ncbi:hypothetical protein C8J57DRAFT_1484531 [Mycena rebaudengoi]|nr:hypothetical protein C8J57DRAFT_1484531 [Mycena rebaudengoi]
MCQKKSESGYSGITDPQTCSVLLQSQVARPNWNLGQSPESSPHNHCICAWPSNRLRRAAACSLGYMHIAEGVRGARTRDLVLLAGALHVAAPRPRAPVASSPSRSPPNSRPLRMRRPRQHREDAGLVFPAAPGRPATFWLRTQPHLAHHLPAVAAELPFDTPMPTSGSYTTRTMHSVSLPTLPCRTSAPAHAD